MEGTNRKTALSADLPNRFSLPLARTALEKQFGTVSTCLANQLQTSGQRKPRQ
jgi:hypothetical protein